MEKAWSNRPLHDWQYQFIFGALPLVLLGLAVLFFPASPVWLFRHRDSKSTEATLVKLRQKHDVAEELGDLKESFVDRGAKVNLVFRLALVVVLQMAFALFNSNALLLRVQVQPAPDLPGEKASHWMIYFGLMTVLGTILSMLTVDNIRRKTIFKDILPFCAAVAIACGILGSVDLNGNTVTNIALFVLYAGAALSLTCATWLTALEVFPPYQHSRYVAVSFSWYYLVQAGVLVTKPSFAASHFVFAALCIVLTIIMFTLCASTKTGAIELKREKKQRQSQEASDLMDEDEETTSYVARASRSQSFRRSRVRRQSSRYQPKTPREGTYENFESPAAQTLSMRRTATSHSSHRSVDAA